MSAIFEALREFLAELQKPGKRTDLGSGAGTQTPRQHATVATREEIAERRAKRLGIDPYEALDRHAYDGPPSDAALIAERMPMPGERR